jgi:bacterioferritin-associated ferredoxin
MIICVCNNVNSSTIRSSIDDGASSVEEIREATGASSCCGKCQFKVNGLLQESEPTQQCLRQANQ